MAEAPATGAAPPPPPSPAMLPEQLRMVFINSRRTLVPAVGLALLLLFTLRSQDDLRPLHWWTFAVIALQLGGAVHGWYWLKHGISPAVAPRLVVALCLQKACDGIAWGSLLLLTLDKSTPAATVLVMTAQAGVIGNAMAIYSPVLPVFITMCTIILGFLVAGVWQLHDPTYAALGVSGVLYYIGMVAHARTSNAAVKSAIALRFEHTELIDRLRQQTEKAAEAQLAAEEANLGKSKFLAAASHDLRQPIHAQGLFLEVLARGELSDAQRAVLGSASAAARASADMLDTLLDISRIEAGVVEAQRRPFHLTPLMNRLEAELAPLAEAKGLVYRTRETHLAVESDPALLILIVRNLLSNAIRYTERGGILVGVRPRGDRAWLEVWDTGIGIARSQQAEIFKEFHQLGNAERDRHKGLGLGLAIAKGLAQTLGHRLFLSSRPGRGSVFRVELPIACGAVVTDDRDVLPASLLPVSDPALLAGLLDGPVLLIDDDEAVRSAMVQLLASWGLRCDAAEGIEDALALAAVQVPGLVISDYRLRGTRTGADGIAALRAACGRLLPALLVTGDTAPERLREARATGVPLLHKPVAAHQLYRAMTEVLQDLRR